MPLTRLQIILLLLPVLFCIYATAFASAITDSLPAKHVSVSFNIDPIANADTPSCIIPFTRAGNLIIIRAKADTTEGGFILDTGAPNLVLNITYFRNYPATQSNDAEQSGITGPVAAVVKTNIEKFYLGTIKYAKVEADLVNLGHLETSKNIKILGLVGMAFFKSCEMIIDYEKSLIYLHLINRKEAATYQSDMLTDTSSYNTIPIEIFNDKILTGTVMAGKKLKLLIDSGAESNVLDSRLPNKVFEDIEITGRIVLRGSGNEKVEALQGDLKNLTIGNRDYGKQSFLITNLERTCFSYDSCINGVLGFDFLSLNRVGFNFVKRKMYIWK